MTAGVEVQGANARVLVEWFYYTDGEWLKGGYTTLQPKGSELFHVWANRKIVVTELEEAKPKTLEERVAELEKKLDGKIDFTK